MSSPSAALREFHEFFGLPARDKLTLPDWEEMEFRLNLLREEMRELEQEILYDRETELDLLYKELADLVYVAYGLDQHLGGKLDAVFAEVHASNMTKLWDCDECRGTGEYWIDATLYNCDGCKGEGKVPRYREDGKVLKPPTYTPPDIAKVLQDAD